MLSLITLICAGVRVSRFARTALAPLRSTKITLLLVVALVGSTAQAAVIKGGQIDPFRCAGPRDGVELVTIRNAKGGYLGGTDYYRCTNSLISAQKDSVGLIWSKFPTDGNGETIVDQTNGKMKVIIRKGMSVANPKNVIFRFCIKPHPTTGETTVVELPLSEFAKPDTVDNDFIFQRSLSGLFRGPGNFNVRKISMIVKDKGEVAFGRVELPIIQNGNNTLTPLKAFTSQLGCDEFDSCP